MSNVNLGNVGVQGGYYGYWTEGKLSHFHRIGRDFQVVNVRKNFETGCVLITLMTEYGNKPTYVTVSRSEVTTPKGVEKLRSQGYDVKMSSVDVFQAVLDIKEEEFLENESILLTHSMLGWERITIENNMTDFVAPLGKIYKSYGHIGNVISDYQGAIDITHKGTLNGQVAFVKQEVQGFTPTEFAVTVGLSAVLVGLIGDIVKVPNIITHFYGDSGNGKSTAAGLGVSTAGYPDIRTMSLFMTWHATPLAILGRIKGNRGMPVALDELSKYQGKDLSSLVYDLSDGRDKDRLNRDTTLKKVNEYDSFRTAIISTGEVSLLTKCNENTGLKIRVLEINEKFTKDAAHAVRIQQGASKNCGWLAPEFAEFLQTKGLDVLLEKHKYWSELYSKVTTISLLKERVSDIYAIILMTADLANECFGFSFSLDNMINMLIKNEVDNAVERNIAEVAYEKFLDFAKANRSHFNIFTHGKGSNQTHSVNGNANPTYGRLDSGIDRVYDERKKIVGEVSYSAAYFPSIVHKLGFEDEKIILKKLKEAGYLNHERDKTYRRRKLNQDDATSSKMYVLYEFEETAEQSLNDTFTEVDDDENPFSEQGKSPS